MTRLFAFIFSFFFTAIPAIAADEQGPEALVDDLVKLLQKT
jgi:hypothetical protein